MESKTGHPSKIVIDNFLIFTKHIERARIVAVQAKKEIKSTPGLKEGYAFVDGEKIHWVLAV